METAAEQCNPLQSVGAEQIQFAINYTLGYLEWAEKKDGGRRGELASARREDEMSSRRGGNVEMSPLDKLVQHYRCGTLGKGMEQVEEGQKGFGKSASSNRQLLEPTVLPKMAFRHPRKKTKWHGKLTTFLCMTFSCEEMNEWPGEGGEANNT
jgi:hypothetical protein